MHKLVMNENIYFERLVKMDGTKKNPIIQIIILEFIYGFHYLIVSK